MPSNAREDERHGEMKQIYSIFETVKKLDNIDTDVKEIKKSLEFAHAEIDDIRKVNQAKIEEPIETLDQERKAMRVKVIDLQARSMSNNLLCFNMPENKDENTTEMIHEILDLSISSYWKKESGKQQRPSVVKFNWHQDKEFAQINAWKLKGTKSGLAEQFPEEIGSVRKTLYPELRA